MQFPFNIIGNVSFSTDGLAGLIFLISVLFVGIVSVILFFHWRKYGMGGKVLAIAEVIYLIGSALLLAGAFFSIN